jgi:hypothetical protein
MSDPNESPVLHGAEYPQDQSRWEESLALPAAGRGTGQVTPAIDEATSVFARHCHSPLVPPSSVHV